MIQLKFTLGLALILLLFPSGAAAQSPEAKGLAIAREIEAEEQLAEEIRDAGHDVWLDLWRIDLGDSIIQRMDEGLAGAAYAVVFYSSSGVMSPWMPREWMSALARQLSEHNMKLLPVVLTGGGPPAILADLKYVDLTRDWAARWKTISGAVSDTTCFRLRASRMSPSLESTSPAAPLRVKRLGLVGGERA